MNCAMDFNQVGLEILMSDDQEDYGRESGTLVLDNSLNLELNPIG